MSLSQQRRLASGTTEEREACLQQMSSIDCMASATTEEREAHLQQISLSQLYRLASENVEERPAYSK